MAYIANEENRAYAREWYHKHKAQCQAGNRERYKRVRHTPQLKAQTAWSHIIERAGNNNGRNPTYTNVEVRMTRGEFIEWAIPQYEEKLNEDPTETWSIDRIENKGHYELGNLQVISMGENSRKSGRNKLVHAPEGMSWCRQCKQYKKCEEFGIDKSRATDCSPLCIECSGAKHTGRGAGKTWRTDGETAKIRKLYATGKYTMRQVGAMVGRSAQTVCNVLKE
jgi:hypothetical protein